jgi:uncharacterized protein
MKIKSITALLLSLPVPTIGVLFGMVLFPGLPAGQVVFMSAKIWILLFPLIWYFHIEKNKIEKFKCSANGILPGVISGGSIFVIIVAAFIFIGKDMIDPDQLKKTVFSAGVNNPLRYILLSCYWTLINSLLEEYFWRWFLVRVCKNIFGSTAAILISAIGFSIHHIIAMQVYFTWNFVLLCTLGIITGGIIWSRLFITYKTIIPGYISHAMADAALFTIGYLIIFG